MVKSEMWAKIVSAQQQDSIADQTPELRRGQKGSHLGRSRKKRNEIRDWLRAEFKKSGGWLPARTIRKRGRVMGYSWSTLKVVRAEEGIRSVGSHRYGGRRIWLATGL